MNTPNNKNIFSKNYKSKNLSNMFLESYDIFDVCLDEAFNEKSSTIVIQNCKIKETNARKINISNVIFKDTFIKDTDFEGSTLENVSFPGCALVSVNLNFCNLKNIDFSNAIFLENVTMNSSKLIKIKAKEVKQIKAKEVKQIKAKEVKLPTNKLFKSLNLIFKAINKS